LLSFPFAERIGGTTLLRVVGFYRRWIMISLNRQPCGGILRGGALLVVCLLTACVATVEPHPAVLLEMAGSTSMQSLMEELAEAYSNRYDYVNIDIKARGSTLGLEGLGDGIVDVALVSRELASEEEEELRATVIAYDAIAILVNDGNAVDSLSSQQVKDIFGGDILLWSEIGGEEVDIEVLSREDGAGTREAFEEMLMGDRRVTLTAIVMPSNQAVGQFVAENPLAIGYASAVDVPLGARPLRVDGVEPNLQAVTQRDYLLIRPFVLVTQKRPGDEVQAFVNFILSPAGQVIVARRYGRVR
jgi:phosphate transport system substrate-binding protein